MPATKIHLALPELDQFTEQQRAHIVARVRGRTDPVAILAELWTLMKWSLGIIGGGVAVFYAIKVSRDAVDGSTLHALHRLVSRNLTEVEVGAILATIVAAWVALLRVRDAGLRTAVRRQLKRTACPECCTTLVGARRTKSVVECGSCGNVHQLKTLKPALEDLGPPPLPFTAATTCPGCGYVVGGLPTTKGAVTCPECGVRTDVLVPWSVPEEWRSG